MSGGSPAVPTDPKDKWRIETNDRYSKMVSSIISLATGALVLPILFLRNFLALSNDKPILPLLDWHAYAAWFFLVVSIFLGLAYSWLSVKWVKLAWGQAIWLSEGVLELLLDASFVGMAISFLAGIALMVCFFVRFHVAG
jgi:hypothetical protein